MFWSCVYCIDCPEFDSGDIGISYINRKIYIGRIYIEFISAMKAKPMYELFLMF